jgi:hypothetical protein
MSREHQSGEASRRAFLGRALRVGAGLGAFPSPRELRHGLSMQGQTGAFGGVPQPIPPEPSRDLEWPPKYLLVPPAA